MICDVRSLCVCCSLNVNHITDDGRRRLDEDLRGREGLGDVR